MADITHNDPLVTEDKLKDFYEDIKPFLGCPAYVTQEGGAEYYSTEEKVIGRWTDNKPLYQRTLFISNSYTSEVVVPNTGTGISVNGITDVFMTDIKPTLDKIINIQMDTNNRSYSGSSFHHSYQFRFNKDNGYVATVDNYNVGYQENIALYPGASFTFKYTKSTDSAVTTIEQKSTHYSTDEQVVGTWIDGKPIYQKTLSFTTGAVGSDTIVATIDTFCKIKEMNGVIESDSLYPFPINFYYNSSIYASCYEARGEIHVIVSRINEANCPAYLTIKYTKTTD